MRLVKVAAGCLNQTPLDFKGNEKKNSKRNILGTSTKCRYFVFA